MDKRVKSLFPGLIVEPLPSGAQRYRVRVAGNKKRRITLSVTPEDKTFSEHYHAARRGVKVVAEKPPEEMKIRNSIAWLSYMFEADCKQKVADDQMSPLTLKKTKHFMHILRKEYGEYAMQMPRNKVIELRDKWAAKPATADSLISTIRSMYKWAMLKGYCEDNPAIGVPTIDRGKGGAIPWTIADLNQFRTHHPQGTMPHLALTLFMFTACRISDAVSLGRKNEFQHNGVRAIGWQPAKRGSAYVEIPMLPPLYKATRASSVVGDTYLLNGKGQPFSTPDSLGQLFRRWCNEAGLKNRSSHGIRKAAGHLLAKQGCTQYQIMAIHGHTQAKTSEVYTKGVERWQLAADAMKRLEGMEW